MHTQLIALVGGSGSGKTWLANRLLRDFGAAAATGLSQDHFYRDLGHLSPGERRRVNFDHPAALDWPLFEETLARLRRGEPAEVPRYDFATHTRSATSVVLPARRLVVVDGLWLLGRPEWRAWFGLSIYVDCLEAVRRERRLARDQRERGRCARAVLEQFSAHVVPMHQRHVAPQRRHADVVVASPLTPAAYAALSDRCLELFWQEEPA